MIIKSYKTYENKHEEKLSSLQNDILFSEVIQMLNLKVKPNKHVTNTSMPLSEWDPKFLFVCRYTLLLLLNNTDLNRYHGILRVSKASTH